MAYNLILKNGSETGATVADKLNIIITDLNEAGLETIPTQFNNISSQLQVLSSDVNDLETDMLTAQQDINNRVNILDIGFISMNASETLSQSITTAYNKLGWVDNVYVNESNSHVSYDIVNKRTNFNTAGYYQIFVNGIIAASKDNELSFQWYRNGQAFDPAPPPVFITNGASKPISVSDNRVFLASQGDYLEVFGKATSNDTLLINSSGLTVSKLK